MLYRDMEVTVKILKGNASERELMQEAKLATTLVCLFCMVFVSGTHISCWSCSIVPKMVKLSP